MINHFADYSKQSLLCSRKKFNPLSWLLFVSATKQARYGLVAVVLERTLSDLRFQGNYFGRVFHVE